MIFQNTQSINYEQNDKPPLTGEAEQLSTKPDLSKWLTKLLIQLVAI